MGYFCNPYNKKGAWKFILKKTVRICTKNLKKLIIVTAIAITGILSIWAINHKYVYKVFVSDTEIGLVANKDEIEDLINKKITNSDSQSVAYVDIAEMPTYKLALVNSWDETNEKEVLDYINDNAVITYKVYSVAVNGNNTAYVNSIEEAEEAVNKIKEDQKDKLDEIDISVNEIYTKDIHDVANVVQVASAVETVEVEIVEVVKENERIKAATLDGVYFGVRPVKGTITSRYGDVESIRSHAHSGLDIAAPAGTDIVAAADGEVTFSGRQGGYGNLIIITHENGIESYYGHCSKLYAKVGDKVEAGDLIAAVGSTGHSTGNHLHFEIRKNGTTINPQRYLYN